MTDLLSDDGIKESPQKRPAPKRRDFSGARKVIGTVVLCVASSVLTVWGLLAVGIIKPDASQTIEQNRQSIVLQQGEVVAEVFKKVSPTNKSLITTDRLNSTVSAANCATAA